MQHIVFFSIFLQLTLKMLRELFAFHVVQTNMLTLISIQHGWVQPRRKAVTQGSNITQQSTSTVSVLGRDLGSELLSCSPGYNYSEARLSVRYLLMLVSACVKMWTDSQCRLFSKTL